MAARLLSIAHSLESSELACVLQSLDGQICWDRKTWDNFEPEALLQSEAQLILAHAVPKTEETASFFQWLRRRRLPIPTVAVLPESVDRELLAIVSEAADDFILWPMQSRELALRIAKLLPSKPSVQLRNPLRDPTGLPHVVGQHPLFLQALEQVPLCASSQAPMLITGETGTGKEVFARSIHSSSTRQGGPFIPVDCAGLPEHLIESELFGHCRGAFTDASTSRKGLVAMAEGGTLFLDEVDTLSLVSQSKLLRLLEEGTYRSLGSDRFVRSSARIIAATN